MGGGVGWGLARDNIVCKIIAVGVPDSFKLEARVSLSTIRIRYYPWKKHNVAVAPRERRSCGVRAPGTINENQNQTVGITGIFCPQNIHT